MASSADVIDADVLIDEARQHQRRRRRRWSAVVIAVALVGTGLGLGVTFGTGTPNVPARPGPSGVGVPRPVSTSLALNRPEALAVEPSGDVLVANQGSNQILRRTPAGALEVVAGTGRPGFAGDGGPGLDAELNRPWGMAVASNGTIYVADTGNNRVRAIAPSGTITTVAGNGQFGSTGAGGSAVDAEVPEPYDVALGAGGQLYIADGDGVQVVSPNGVLDTVVAAGPGVLSIDGTKDAFFPDAIAVGSSGDLYVADFSPKLLVEFTPTGNAVNRWTIYVTPAGLVTGPDGSILVADYGFSVDRVANGQVTPLVSFGRNSLPALTGTFRPSGITIGNAGQIYAVTDGVSGGTDRPALAAIDASDRARLLPTGTRQNG